MAVAIPFVGLAAWVILNESQHAREEALDRARLVSGSVALRLTEVVAAHGAVLERLAQRPAVRALDASRCDPLIAEYVHLHPELTTLAVRDARGNAVCSHLPGQLVALQEDRFPWFRDGLRSDKLFAGNAFRGHITGRWVTPMTFPIRDDSGKVTGLVVMPVDLLALARRVLRAVPEPMIVEVTDRESNVLMRMGDQGAAIGKPFPANIVEQSRGQDTGTLSSAGVDGIRRLFAFTTVAGTGWRVWAELPQDEVDAVYRNQLITGTALVIPCLLLVLAGSWWLGSSIANPIAALARTAARVAGGHFADRVPAQGPLELAAVARQFNEMLDALDRHRADRAALAGHYEQLLRLARDIVMLIAPDGHIVEANDAAIAAYGYSAEEIRALHMRDLRSPDELADMDQQWEASLNPRGVLFEATHRRKDGSTFPVEVSARVIEIEGRPYRQSFVRDITARKQAEAAVRESEARFIVAVEALQEGAFIQTGGRFVYLNPLAVRMFGAARPEDLLGKPVIDHFDPDSRERVRKRLQLHAEATDAASGGTESPIAPDGPRLDVEVSSVPFVYRGTGATLVFLRDVTESSQTRQRIEEQLDELRRWHAAMLGREARVIELKREVNELLAIAGEVPRYGVTGPESLETLA
jgi:PAS domain S-box-containing protein